MFTLLVTGCAVLGLAIGSFLNVVIYRVPRGQSIVAPPSACPHCATPIAVRDNIPLVSWLMLKGHCRVCHAPISARYPLVEILTAAVFASVAARFGANWALPAFLIVFAGLIALAWIDIEFLMLPRTIVYPVLIMEVASLFIAAGMASEWRRLFIAIACGVVWFLLFFLIHVTNARWLGYGDVRLSLVLGLALGWLGVRYVILGFFLANLVGAVVGITLIAMKRTTRDQQMPYGLYLALGALVAVIAGPLLLAPFRVYA